MGLLSGRTLRFLEYEWGELGVRLRFQAEPPPPGSPSDYYLFLTNAEVEGIANQNQFNTLVQARVNRNWGESAVNTQLNARINGTLTVA